MKRKRMSFLVLLVASLVIVSACGKKEVSENTYSDENQEQSVVMETVTVTPTETVTTTPESNNIFPESRVGYYSNGYWGMDIKEINNEEKTIVYDGYEYAWSYPEPSGTDYTGTIIDADTLLISGVTISWEGDTFTLSDGTQAGIMGIQAFSGHDYEHGAGTYVRSEKPAAGTPIPENSDEFFSGQLNYTVNYGGTEAGNNYVFPESSSFKFSGYPQETQTWLYQYGINEIYAKHGYIFQNQDVLNLFSNKTWYVQNSGFSDSMLTDIEKHNVDYFSRCIQETGGDGGLGLPSNGPSEGESGSVGGRDFFNSHGGYYTNENTYQIVNIYSADPAYSSYDGVLDVAKQVRSIPGPTPSTIYYLTYNYNDTATIVSTKKGVAMECGTITFYQGEIYIDWWNDTFFTGKYWAGYP